MKRRHFFATLFGCLAAFSLPKVKAAGPQWEGELPFRVEFLTRDTVYVKYPYRDVLKAMSAVEFRQFLLASHKRWKLKLPA